jgi:inner membrane protein
VDNLTHTLAAIALSHAGLNRKTRYATLTMIVGANLPDVDLAARIWGSATYLKYHRGITHSILGVTVLALLLAWGVYALGRKQERKSGPPLARGWLLLAAWLGTASHLLLDFTNSYGVRPLMPFSSRWYAWDIMFVFDPLLLGLLVLGLGVPAILRLASEEVGARSASLRRGAAFSLCMLVALWGLRDLAHRRVLSQMEGHTYSQENPQRLGAFPVPGNPFVWTGVVETDSSFHVLSANALDNDVRPESARVLHKLEPSAALEAAWKTRTATIFSHFARFPWAQVEESEDGFVVTLCDLRFFSRLPHRRGFVVGIELDKNLQVRSESFSFWAPTRAGEP